MISKFPRKIVLPIVVAVIFSLVLLSDPFVTSEDLVDIKNLSSMKQFLVFTPISGSDIGLRNLANLTLDVDDDDVEFDFTLVPDDEFNLNYVFVPPRSEIKTASELLFSIPSAEAVSTTDEMGTVSYINLRGGRGIDFQVKPLQVYEVSVSENVNWRFNITL